jgi:hypothetical protein
MPENCFGGEIAVPDPEQSSVFPCVVTTENTFETKHVNRIAAKAIPMTGADVTSLSVGSPGWPNYAMT